MKKIPTGYQNEFLFVLEFNNKKIKELNPLLREVVDDLFPFENDESIVKSWKNHNPDEKADILLKVNGLIRSISIKMGSRNSVHTETLERFSEFLQSCNLNSSVFDEYKQFHYGIDKNNSSNILSAMEYSALNKDSVDFINSNLALIPSDIITRRFILKGNVSKYEVDGLIYGTPDDFLWINKKQVKEIIHSNMNKKSSSVHYSSLFIQPLNRCINNNYKVAWGKDYVQIKWYSLFDDILKYKSNVKI